MNYILKGDPKEVAKVLQENRIRVDRGVIEFAPCQPDSAQEMAQGHVELAGVTRDVIAIIAENGISVPEDLAERLAKFGVIVPKSEETVPNTDETADNTGESVPETVPNEAEAVEDNKAVEAGTDMKEVNLDDVKDAPEEEAKSEPAPAPKKTRSKKSE